MPQTQRILQPKEYFSDKKWATETRTYGERCCRAGRSGLVCFYVRHLFLKNKYTNIQSLALVNFFNIYSEFVVHLRSTPTHSQRLQGKGKRNHSGDSFKLANWWQGLVRVDDTLHGNMVFDGTWQQAWTHTVPSFSFLLVWELLLWLGAAIIAVSVLHIVKRSGCQEHRVLKWIWPAESPPAASLYHTPEMSLAL